MRYLRMLTVLVAMIAASSMSFAQTSGSCGDNLNWSYNEGTGALTIEGTGDIRVYKILEDGHIVIIREGKIYNILGF